MQITNSDLRKLIFKVAAGYAMAISALWGTIVYLHKQLIDTKDMAHREYIKIVEDVNIIKGQQMETQLFGERVIARINQTLLQIYEEAESREGETSNN